MLKIETDVNLISPNNKMHYMTLYKKEKKIKEKIRLLLNINKTKTLSFPLCVKITRFCKRFFDFDNYISSCKPVRDCIADFLIPGKAPGFADSSNDIQWYYHQEKNQSATKDYIRIEIFSLCKDFFL